MNITEIKELIDKINDSDISLFELKLNDNYLKMDKSDSRESTSLKSDNQDATSIVTTEKTKETNFKVENIDNKIVTMDVEELKEDLGDIQIINSPMVGTFYEAPGVDLDAFVKVGDSIKEGDTLCIIEAMKLMNEIEAELSGEVVAILAKNGEMVEYGEPLFKIRRK